MMMALAIVGWSLFSGAVVLFELDRLYLQKRVRSLKDCVEIWRAENRRLREVVLGKEKDLRQVKLNLDEIERSRKRKRNRKGQFTR